MARGGGEGETARKDGGDVGRRKRGCGEKEEGRMDITSEIINERRFLGYIDVSGWPGAV